MLLPQQVMHTVLYLGLLGQEQMETILTRLLLEAIIHMQMVIIALLLGINPRQQGSTLLDRVFMVSQAEIGGLHKVIELFLLERLLFAKEGGVLLVGRKYLFKARVTLGTHQLLQTA